MRTIRSNQNLTRPIALALTTSFALTCSIVAQRPTPSDWEDAILLLHGTPPTPKIDPERIAEIERWLGKIRKAHPEVAEIHQTMGHSTGLATVILQPEANKQLEELVKWKIVDGVWETGVHALDKLGAELGVRFGHGMRWVHSNVRLKKSLARPPLLRRRT